MQKKPKVSETGDPELDAKYNNKMYLQVGIWDSRIDIR